MRRRIMSGMGLFITLFLGVNTFLCFLSKAEALTILDKFPIAVTADNEFGFYGAFDGTNYLVGVGGDLGLGKDLDLACPITAQLVSRSGALLGSIISVGRTGGMGQVAFDGTNYLMVWDDGPADDTGDVHSYGQFISKTGTLVGVPFPISSPSGHSSHQYLGWVRSIAFDGTNYLVVWDNSSDDRYSDDGSYVGDIYGQFVSTSGVLGTKIPIATTTTRGSFSVAFDGTRYRWYG